MLVNYLYYYLLCVCVCFHLFHQAQIFLCAFCGPGTILISSDNQWTKLKRHPYPSLPFQLKYSETTLNICSTSFHYSRGTNCFNTLLYSCFNYTLTLTMILFWFYVISWVIHEETPWKQLKEDGEISASKVLNLWGSVALFSLTYNYNEIMISG